MKNTPSSQNGSLTNYESLILYRNVTQEVTTKTLQVNARKLSFGNTVYQTASIAGFSAAAIKNKFPWIWCLVVAFFFFMINQDLLIIKLFPDNLLTLNLISTMHSVLDIGLIFLLLVVILVWALREERFGLLIISNAGLTSSITIIHENRQFISDIVQILTKNIDNDYHNSYSIDFINNTITQI